jgi:hypothetical protein
MGFWHRSGAPAWRNRHSPALWSARALIPDVDEVIMGQILAAGQGQNPARQAAMAAGIPQEATAWGLNQLCGSGLRAVALGMQQIMPAMPISSWPAVRNRCRWHRTPCICAAA